MQGTKFKVGDIIEANAGDWTHTVALITDTFISTVDDMPVYQMLFLKDANGWQGTCRELSTWLVDGMYKLQA